MAECHPVGLPVGDGGQGARRHGDPRRPAVHAHAARWPTCTCRSAPARDIAFLGGLDQLHPRERALTSGSTSSPTPTPPTIVSEDFRDTEDLDGLFSGYDPETGTYDPSRWSTRAAEHAGGRLGDAEEPTPAVRAGQPAPGTRATGDGRPSATRRCSTRAASSRSCKRHFARYTPGDGRARSAACPRRAFLRGRRGAVRRTRAASAPPPSCYAVGWTQHTVGVQYIRAGGDHPAAAGQHRPARAAASWPCAATPPSRARPTSRRCSTCCPGYLPMPQRAASTTTLGDYVDATTGRRRAAGPQLRHVRRVSCSRPGTATPPRRRTTSASTTCPRLTGDHSHLPTVDRHARRQGARATSCFGQNPAVGSTQRRACSALGLREPRLAGRARPRR